MTKIHPMIRLTHTFVFGLRVRFHFLVKVVVVILPLLRLFLQETQHTEHSLGARHMGRPRQGRQEVVVGRPLRRRVITYSPHSRLFQDVLQVVLCVCGESRR